MVPENMPDHQNPTVRGCHFNEMLAVLHIDGERLLDEDVLSGLQGRLRHLVVGDCRRRQRHGRYERVREHLGEVVAETHAFVIAFADRFDSDLGVAEHAEDAELVEIPDEVLSPVADADDGDVARGLSERCRLHRFPPLRCGSPDWKRRLALQRF